MEISDFQDIVNIFCAAAVAARRAGSSCKCCNTILQPSSESLMPMEAHNTAQSDWPKRMATSKRENSRSIPRTWPLTRNLCKDTPVICAFWISSLDNKATSVSVLRPMNKFPRLFNISGIHGLSGGGNSSAKSAHRAEDNTTDSRRGGPPKSPTS